MFLDRRYLVRLSDVGKILNIETAYYSLSCDYVLRCVVLCSIFLSELNLHLNVAVYHTSSYCPMLGFICPRCIFFRIFNTPFQPFLVLHLVGKDGMQKE